MTLRELKDSPEELAWPEILDLVAARRDSRKIPLPPRRSSRASVRVRTKKKRTPDFSKLTPLEAIQLLAKLRAAEKDANRGTE